MILYILPPTSENKEQKLKIIRWAKTAAEEMIVGRRVEYSHFFPRGLKSQEWRDTSQFPLFKTPGKLKALCKIKMSSESMANQAIKSTRNLGHTYKGKSANSMKFEFSFAEWDFWAILKHCDLTLIYQVINVRRPTRVLICCRRL